MECLIALLRSLPAVFLAKHAQIVVCGSGPMAIRGMRDVHDLDLLVSQELFDLAPSCGFENPDTGVDFYQDAGSSRLLAMHTPAGKIDVFRTTPKLDRTYLDQLAHGVERYQVPGVGLVAFQGLRDVLAIKALCPTKPKHVADMVSITQRLAIEESPVQPFEPFGPTDAEGIRALNEALGVAGSDADIAARLDKIAREGVDNGIARSIDWTTPSSPTQIREDFERAYPPGWPVKP